MNNNNMISDIRKELRWLHYCIVLGCMVKCSTLCYSHSLFTTGGPMKAAEIKPVLEKKLAYLSGIFFHSLMRVVYNTVIWEAGH